MTTIVAFFTVITLLLKLSAAFERLPTLDTFATYEDMQRYVDNRNLRSLRIIDNPNDDTYIAAFNQHNEQTAAYKRSRRSNVQRKLPSEPRLLKFGIEDAVEPSDEVKALLKQYRKVEEKVVNVKPLAKTTTTAKPSANATEVAAATTTAIAKSRKTRMRKLKRRQKRAIQQRQPANFKVEFIPFEATDARDPDEQTKQLIKRMRAVDLQRDTGKLHAKVRVARSSEATIESNRQLSVDINAGLLAPTVSQSQTATRTQSLVPYKQLSSANPFKSRTRKTKRNKRSAPEMIKFELADAKEPDMHLKSLMQHERASKSLNISMANTGNTGSPTVTAANDTNAAVSLLESRSDMDMDQSGHESKRMFIYKESPMKSKKSINNLPHEVQKVISHILKDPQHGGKALIKHIPSQKMDYEYLKSFYSAKLPAQQVYGLKLHPASFVKYVPVVAKPEVQIQTVPVVEKLRYVYAPATHVVHSYTQPKYATPVQSHAIPQPIIVPDVAQHAEVQQHTYAAAEPPPHQPAEVEVKNAPKEIHAPRFRPSKPDPLLEDNKLPEPTSYVQASLGVPHIKHIEQYQYELYPQKPEIFEHQPQLQAIANHQQQAQPVIKIEYHAPPDPVKENFKELAEFKELSALIGKSPDDQIHGLTYLLAKEMQSKLQSQAKQLENERPQDNTSPILFHPKQEQHNEVGGGRKAIEQQPSHLAIHSGRLIGMAKAKQYIPIVEQSNENKAETAATEEVPDVATHIKFITIKAQEPKTPSQGSYVQYGHDLSSGYEGLSDGKQAEASKEASQESNAGHFTQHQTVAYYAEPEQSQSSGEHAAGGVNYNINHDVKKLQYASKYAFGYRIRDFLTGNDYGHKQNLDSSGVTHGQYHILLPDGRVQNVIYHADDTGFHADVSFETGKH